MTDRQAEVLRDLVRFQPVPAAYQFHLHDVASVAHAVVDNPQNVDESRPGLKWIVAGVGHLLYNLVARVNSP